MTVKVLVCGSRDWTDGDLICDYLDALMDEIGSFTVIHGGARGADTIAGQWGRTRNFEVIEFPARWNTFGKRAGAIRNREMADQGPDLVVAFLLNDSSGTQLMLDIATQRGIRTRVIALHDPEATS